MDFRRILSDTVVSGLRTSLVILRGIIIIPIITKFIGGETYGLWASTFALVSLAMTVGGLHLHGALIRYLKPDDRQAFSDMLALILISSTVASSIFLISGVMFEKFVENVLNMPSELLLVGGLLLFSQVMIEFSVNYPRALSRVKTFELLQSVRMAFGTVVLGLIIFYTRDIILAFLGLAITDLALALLLIAFYLRRSDFPLPDPLNFTKYLRYGVPMIPKGVSHTIISSSDRILIISFLGPAAAGIYSVAYGAGSLLKRPGGLLNSTLYPNVTSAWDDGEIDELSQFYTGFIKAYLILIVPAVFGLSMLASEVIRLLSTESIATQGAILIPILSVGFAMQGLESTLSYPLAADERTTQISKITIVVAGINLVMNVVLLPIIGVIGAGIATTVAFSIRSVWLLISAKRLFTIQLPWMTLYKSIAASSLMVLGLNLIPNLNWQVKLVVFPATGILIYTVAIVLLRGITVRKIQKLRSTI